MKLLAVDTSTRAASIAVLDDNRVLAEVRDESGDHSDRLIGLIDDMLRQSGLALGDLDAMAIGAGPGSFTGLRIGMATVKGLAFASDKPLWAVSSLAAIAARVDGQGATHIAVVADARRKEVFVGVFDAATLEPIGDERVLPPASLAEVLAELGCRPASTALVGEGLALYPEAAAELGTICEAALPYPSAEGVAAVAIAGSRTDGRALATPVYIRPSEAEIRFPNGNPGGTFAPPTTKP